MQSTNRGEERSSRTRINFPTRGGAKKAPSFARRVAIFLAPTAFVAALVATFAASETASAVDLSLNFPLSRLFGGSRDADDSAVDASATDAATVESPFDPRATASFNPGSNFGANVSTRDFSGDVPASASASARSESDSAPMFAKRLPYCSVLGKVVCEANFPLDSIAGLEEEIARLQLDLVGYLGVPEANETIELCLFRDKGSYIDFVGAVFPTAPLDRPALYVKANGPGVLMIPRDDRMIVNIRHEMTHAYLNASLRNVPIWLDEGLAKYFETPPGERGFRNPFLKVAQRDATGLFGAPPSLDRLEKLTRVDQMRSREYREAWSWVHFMLHYSNDTHRVLGYYLKSLRPEAQAGVSAKDAFKAQKKAPMKALLEKYVPDYERKYVDHFRGWEARQDAYESSRKAEVARAEAATSK